MEWQIYLQHLFYACKQVYKSNSGATSFIGVANLFATLTLSFLQTSLQVQ